MIYKQHKCEVVEWKEDDAGAVVNERGDVGPLNGKRRTCRAVEGKCWAVKRKEVSSRRMEEEVLGR